VLLAASKLPRRAPASSRTATSTRPRPCHTQVMSPKPRPEVAEHSSSSASFALRAGLASGVIPGPCRSAGACPVAMGAQRARPHWAHDWCLPSTCRSISGWRTADLGHELGRRGRGRRTERLPSLPHRGRCDRRARDLPPGVRGGAGQPGRARGGRARNATSARPLAKAVVVAEVQPSHTAASKPPPLSGTFPPTVIRMTPEIGPPLAAEAGTRCSRVHRLWPLPACTAGG